MSSDPLALYIHWPYCARLCPYCDFNIYKDKKNTELVPAILKDMASWREQSGPRTIGSIHFGGGTPSLLRPDQVNSLIKTAGEIWELDSDCEISLEANPDDADRIEWRALREAGVGRLSLGVQSFNDFVLNTLGRNHDRDTAVNACELAREVFDNVSIDLIFGWTGQTLEDLSADIDTALAFRPDHLSTYQLTIEPGTAFAKAESRGDYKAVDSDQSADLYDYVRDRLIGLGFGHYEISNFAQPGYASRHNLTYWRGGDYAGLGPGAHGRLTNDGVRKATIAAMHPKDYCDLVARTGTGIDQVEILSAEAWGEEYLLMGLRIDEGISLSRYAQLSGQSLSQSAINDLSTAGLIRIQDDCLRSTPAGRLVLNAITEALLLS